MTTRDTPVFIARPRRQQRHRRAPFMTMSKGWLPMSAAPTFPRSPVSWPAPDDPVFAMHRGGKISVRPTVDVADRAALAMAYTPGVARVCTAIAERPGLAADYTWVANTVAIVTDGTAVLGLGDIGPAAAIVTLAALRGAARVAGKEFGLSSSSVAEAALAAMAPVAIVFALSNPDPEVHPDRK